MAANVYASATDGGTSDAQVLSGAATIDCPDVATELTEVPDQARAEVDKELANLDAQIAEAYKRLGESADAIRQDPGFAENAIAGPLKDKRAAVLARIGAAVEKAGAERPQGLDDLAGCAVRDSGNAPAPEEGGDGGEQAGDGQDQQNGDGRQGGDQQGGGQDQGGQDQGGNGGQAGNGPVPGDYVSIESVQPNVDKPQPSGDASTGTFTSECGVNENGLFNSDNVIAAPGVSNGAHHFHDYIGNQATNAFVSDDELTRAETSCEDQRDKSSYYWPVLRLQNGTEEQDAQSPGGGIEGNVGEIVTPKDVTLTFVGNPKAKVTAMPRLLRIITGDAKSFVNGPANANASWSCTGFEDRQLKDKYPLCPEGSDVVRSFAFQSCWDGRNIDSANHRTHMAFTDAEGNCPSGFQPIPQLVQRIVYDVDAPSLEDGGKTVPLFAVDSFPEQLHKPITDHGDFINVFEEDLMNEVVACINEGRTCGAGAGGGDNGGGDNGGDDGNAGGNGNGGGDNGAEQPTATPDDPGQGNGGGQNDGNQGGGKDDGGQGGGQGDQDGGQEPPAATEKPADDKATAQPDVKVSDPADAGGKDDERGGADQGKGGNDDGGQAAQAAQVPGSLPELEDNTQAQGAGGSLAETGAQMWPAAIGGVLVIFGFFVLRSVRRNA
ncbi:membrane protein [Streptomyces griseorubens]|uniref:Membrane protein n=2 Tax=Streptomyces griseorubens TaxID=66897 RepID=A0ABR4T927_9ACTN|nr:membrane protein [Streptomyces griseorubens]